MNVDGVRIVARGITARGRQGPVFENVDARVEPGELAVIAGATGTGKTSLLLALSGRFPLVAGHLEVSGEVLPARAKRVRRLITPARLQPAVDVEKHLRVREAITERRLLGRVSDAAIMDSFALVGINPVRGKLIGALHPSEQVLLAVALAAADSPSGIVVDDVDAGLPAAARTRVWAALHELARTGTTVLASATDPPASTDIVVVALPPSRTWENSTTDELDFADAVLVNDTLRFSETPTDPLATQDTDEFDQLINTDEPTVPFDEAVADQPASDQRDHPHEEGDT